MSGKGNIQLIKNDVRLDGRRPDQLRPIEAKVGILKNAEGSAYFRMGNTTAIAGVFGPKKVFPKHQERADRAILRTDYRMAPFSTSSRARPGPSRRSQEISLVTRQALMPVVLLEEFPKTAIDVTIEIIQADAGTRCVGINAASLALADAGIPMRDLVAACSAGIIDKTVVLDISGKEDTEGSLDMPVAYYPKRKEITLLQMDGITERKQLMEILKTAIRGCESVYEEQKRALKRAYEAEARVGPIE